MTTPEPPSLDRRSLEGWPLIVGLAGYPVAWLFGLELVIWPLVAGLLLLELLLRPRPLMAPRGIVLYLAFLAWNVAGLMLVTEFDRLLAWAFRFSHYFGALIIMVFLASAVKPALLRQRLAISLIILWVWVVLGGVLGVLLPTVAFPSVLAALAPGLTGSAAFIQESTNLEFGSVQEFLGAVRPKTFFAYTNEWAGALGVLTPLALFGYRYLRSAWAKVGFGVTFAVGLVVAVLSVNRGLWVSLGVVVVAGAVLSILYGRVGTVVTIGVGSLAALLIAATTPLAEIVRFRLFETPNLSTRENLVGAALDATSRSPVLGFGTPVADEYLADSNSVSVGTHGQLWTLLVSNGYVATGLYLLFLVVVLVLSFRKGPAAAWLQVAIVVLLVQSAFYSAVPMPLTLVAVAIGILSRLPDRDSPQGSPLPLFLNRSNDALAS